MTYPLDGGTYGTNADGSLVPFVALGYVDVPGQMVSIYEDATSALLGSAAANLTPESSGAWAGWYAWAIPISSWTTSAGALLPAMGGTGAMVPPSLAGTHPFLPMAGVGALADTSYSTAFVFALPAMAGRGAVGGVGITAVASLSAMPGRGAMNAPTITTGGGSYDNHYAQAVIGIPGQGFWVRRSAGAPYTGIRAWGYEDAGDWWIQVDRVVNGSVAATLWVSDVGTGSFPSPYIRLEALDGNVTVKHDGTDFVGMTSAGAFSAGGVNTGSAVNEGCASYTTGSLP